MNKYWDNLQSFEKRVVVGVAAAIFAVANFWFVFPHFHDLDAVERHRSELLEKRKKYLAVLADAPKYQQEVEKLQGGPDSTVPLEEQGLDFSSAINRKAAQFSVTINSFPPPQVHTNDPIFIERTANISTSSTESNLVDFLVSLGSDSSLIRVRDLGLHTDGPRYNLIATISLVGMSQKKSAPKLAPLNLPASVKSQSPSPQSGSSATSTRAPTPAEAPVNAAKQP